VKCPNCGKRVRKEEFFCTKCSKKRKEKIYGTIKDIIIASVFFLAGLFLTETFAELEISGKITNETLFIQINNTAWFMDTGEIRIYGMDENEDEILVERFESIPPKSVQTVPIKFNVSYRPVPTEMGYMPGVSYFNIPPGAWLIRHVYYKIECDNCRPHIGWKRVAKPEAGITTIMITCRRDNITQRIICNTSEPIASWVEEK